MPHRPSRMQATSDLDDMRGPAIEGLASRAGGPGRAADFPPRSGRPGPHKASDSPQSNMGGLSRAYTGPGLDSGPVDTHKNAHTKPARIDAVCGETRGWITGHICLMSTDI
jgi:hypothetical protein